MGTEDPEDDGKNKQKEIPLLVQDGALREGDATNCCQGLYARRV